MTNLTERPHFKLTNEQLETEIELTTRMLTRTAQSYDCLEERKMSLYEKKWRRENTLECVLKEVEELGRVIQISPYLRRN